MKKRGIVALVAVLALVLAACGGNGSETTTTAGQTTTTGAPTTTIAGQTTTSGPAGLSGELLGIGASFPNNVYQEWILDYTSEVQTGVSINYTSAGSGAGRTGFIRQEADWGTSEGFMNAGELEEAQANRGCPAVLWPVLFGAVTVAFGYDSFNELILTPEVIADIFEGRITNYNDPAIAALNPERSLPDLAIQRIVRADSSGTTQVFTNFLANHTENFETAPGGLPNWPGSPIGGAQNAGVARLLSQNTGGIGYVGQDYALEAGLPVAKVVNSSGNPVSPTLEATETTLETIEIPVNEAFAIRDVTGEGYPIVAAVWNITAECGYEGNTAELLQNFWTWAVDSEEARARALELGFVSLPDGPRQEVLELIGKIGSAD